MTAIVEPIAAWIATTVATWAGNAAVAAGANVATTIAVAKWTYIAVATVSQFALYAGMQYAVDAVSRPKQKPLGSELNLNIDPAYPREMIIGQRAIGGSMVARYSRGSNLYNAHLVIQLADHPCTELSKVYDGGRLVRDTPLTHGTRTEITAYSISGGPRLWMTWHDGRPGQTADSDLVTKSAQDPEVIAGNIEGWTSSHTGAGNAYVHVEVQWDQDILTSLPQFLFLVKGAPLYDRRKDTTAGGSGSHRLDNPSTWEYSTNARVALDHYLLGYTVEDEEIAFGIGLSPGEVPYADFEYGADLCDEDVVTGTGLTVETIKRYAANGVISSADYFEDVIESFQYQMAARVVDLGGRIGVIGAEERAVVVSLTEDDLIEGEPLQFADKLPFSDLFGSVTGTFSDPANLYQPTPLAPLVSAYNALPDGGEAQAVNLQLPYEVHPRRAARLTSAWFVRESLQPRLVGVFTPKAWKLEVGDWFEFTSARLQVAAEKFEVIDITKNEDFTVVITARAISADFVAFDNDNDPALSVLPEVDPVSLLLDTPTFTAAASTMTAGGVVEPAILATLTSTETVAREIVWEYGVWNGSAVVTPTQTDSMHVSQASTKLRKGVLPSTDYKVRAKARAGLRESAWSSWSSVVTTAAAYALSAGIGVNGLNDTEFRYLSANWRSTPQSGTVSTAVNTSTNGIRRASLTGAGVTVGNYLQLDSNTQTASFPCLPGDTVEASAWIGGTNLSSVRVFIDFRDAAGANTGFSTATIDSSPTAGGGELSTFERLVSIGVAPANTVKAMLCARGNASTSAPVLQVTKPMLAKAQAGQTVVSPWNPGLDAEAGANVTETRVAVAIAAQGTQATANHQRGTSYSGTPVDGSWWADTSTNLLKLYTGGAWQTVSDITPASSPDVATFTKQATINGAVTSGTTATTMATIDVNDVGASGYLSLPLGNFLLGDATISLSAGTSWIGEVVLTEQLQSGGTEYELLVTSLTVTDTGGGFFSLDWPLDIPPWPSALIAQNLSGNVRYRLKIRRTSGSNNITGGGLDGRFMIQRVPG